jgi:hypothetical protein
MPCRADAVCVNSATKHHGASSLMATEADSRLTRAGTTAEPTGTSTATTRRSGPVLEADDVLGLNGWRRVNDPELVHRGCVAKPDGDADRPAA